MAPHVHTTIGGRLACKICKPMASHEFTTPDNISELGYNEVFVFGSNTAGRHGRGAAWQAYQYFDAEMGVGEGLTGKCYAFPTLDADRVGSANLRKRSYEDLCRSMIRFETCVKENPHKVFLLTKVGCGLACYSEEYMRSFFEGINEPNLVKPKGW